MDMVTLRQKIGQLFLVSCQGEALSNQERLLIEGYQFAGLILFQKNCGEPRQLVSLCRAIWEAFDTMSPFIAIDQEGGRVHRLPAPFSHFPAAASIGAPTMPSWPIASARQPGRNCNLAGINLNFAPVLDVRSNPTSPVIGDRSFAAEPNRVITIAAAWTRGLRDGGVKPCGKHFPGHGGADKDSHFELPLVRQSMEELQATEFPPFADACRNKIESLMTAHVAYPALDDLSMPSNPSE